MTELDTQRLADLFAAAYEAAATQATNYTYRDRAYRVRTVTVVIGEMGNGRGDWTPLPQRLTAQLLAKVDTGEAVKS